MDTRHAEQSASRDSGRRQTFARWGTKGATIASTPLRFSTRFRARAARRMVEAIGRRREDVFELCADNKGVSASTVWGPAALQRYGP